MQQEIAKANRCQLRGAKRVGVQAPPPLQRCRKVGSATSWSDPFGLVCQTVTKARIEMHVLDNIFVSTTLYNGAGVQVPRLRVIERNYAHM